MAWSRTLTEHEHAIMEQADILHSVGNDLMDWVLAGDNQSWTPYREALDKAEAALARLRELIPRPDTDFR